MTVSFAAGMKPEIELIRQPSPESARPSQRSPRHYQQQTLDGSSSQTQDSQQQQQLIGGNPSSQQQQMSGSSSLQQPSQHHHFPPPLSRSVVDLMARGSGRGSPFSSVTVAGEQQQQGQEQWQQQVIVCLICDVLVVRLGFALILCSLIMPITSLLL